jgi:penicillin-binding protein 1A
MENVHGIAVSGGSFPAEIWRLFMERALEDVEPTPFGEPSVWPEWQAFTRGRYALTYDPTYTPETTESDDTETTETDQAPDDATADSPPSSPASPATPPPEQDAPSTAPPPGRD